MMVGDGDGAISAGGPVGGGASTNKDAASVVHEMILERAAQRYSGRMVGWVGRTVSETLRTQGTKHTIHTAN